VIPALDPSNASEVKTIEDNAWATASQSSMGEVCNKQEHGSWQGHGWTWETASKSMDKNRMLTCAGPRGSHLECIECFGSASIWKRSLPRMRRMVWTCKAMIGKTQDKTLCSILRSRNAHGRCRRATSCEDLQVKCRRPKATPTLFADLRNWNVLGHFTRAILYEKLQVNQLEHPGQAPAFTLTL
jgi:hypothetical protein